MKKLTDERRAYNIRVTAKRTARNASTRRAQRHGATAADTGRQGRKRAPERLAAPEHFDVNTAGTRAELTAFLRRLRSLAIDQDMKVKIDFRATTQMRVAGTLLLAAEIDRINALTKDGRVTCTYPRDAVVAQVLEHVGIFEMLGQRRTTKITHETVKYWKVDSGDTVKGERAHHAIEAYKDRFSDPKRKAMYRALTEAMTNCRQHAYPKHRKELVRNWWMFSQFKDNQLTVGLGDLGIGIPDSLREDEAGLLGPIMELLRALHMSPHDGNLIQSAMKISKSRTKEQHRGKGLADMRRVLDGLKGTLQIHSRRGFYAYDAATGRERCTNFKKSMSVAGTLVLWVIPMAQPEGAS